jgi:hypothetical protein
MRRTRRYRRKNPLSSTETAFIVGGVGILGFGIWYLVSTKNAAVANAQLQAFQQTLPTAVSTVPSVGGQVYDPNLGGSGPMPGYTQVPGVDTAQNWAGVTTTSPPPAQLPSS